MATRGVPTIATYRAWDTGANAPKTGDAANHTLLWVKDGVAATAANSPAEVNSSTAPGIYKITITSTETDCTCGSLVGKSSAASVYLFGAQFGFEYVPVSAAISVDASGNVTTTSTTNIAISDALLNRDMSAVSDTNARSPLNAFRFLRNKWSISSGTLTVTKENDSTSAWTSTVSTDAAAVPIIGNDPA